MAENTELAEQFQLQIIHSGGVMLKMMLFLRNKIQHVNFHDNPLYRYISSYKTTLLNNSEKQ